MISFWLSSSLFISAALSNPNLVHPSYQGASGTFHSISALQNEETTFGVQALGRFFFEEPFIDGEKHSRNILRMSGNYTFAHNIEAFGGFQFTFNEHSNADSSRSQTSFLENTDLGVKWSTPIFDDCCFLGVAAVTRFFSGSQSIKQTSGFSDSRSGPFAQFYLSLISSIDFGRSLFGVPFRMHGNVGWRSPNSNIDTNSSSVANRNTDIEIFNQDAIRYHSIVGNIALEAPYRWVTPILEFRGEYIPFSSPPVGLSNSRINALMGARGNLHPAFALLAAVDLKLSGSAAGSGADLAENPSWDFYFGASFTTEANKFRSSTGSVSGRVLDGTTGIPLPEVQATLVGAVTLPRVSDLSGFYQIPNLKDGNYQVRFTKLGYESQTQNFEVKSGKPVILDVALTSLGPKSGDLRAQILDVVTNQPIARAFVRLSGAERPLTSDENGDLLFEDIREGSHNLRIEAPGYEPADFPIEIFPNEEITQSFALRPEAPKTGTCFGRVTNEEGTGLTAVISAVDGRTRPFGTDPLTGEFVQDFEEGVYPLKVQAENYLPQEVSCEVVTGTRFELNVVLKKPERATLVENKIILPEAIFFGFDSAEIESRSFRVLNQIVRVLMENRESYQQLLIEGHTDDMGSNEYNQELSERRAQAVKNYLIEKGLEAERIQALGFGEEQPIATNTTEEGRAENRRVEFNLVQEGQNL